MEKPRAEVQYLNYAQQILDEGEATDDRTNVGTIDLFGEPQMCYDLRTEFPLLTSKFVAIKAIKSELAWMLHGDTNLRYLVERDNHIWDEWPFTAYLETEGIAQPPQGSDEWKRLKKDFLEKIKTDDEFAATHGDLGPIYGHQWRAWQGYNGESYDQLRDIQAAIREENKELGRRMIVSAWNAAQIEEMDQKGLPPCHTLFQFNAPNATDPKTGKKYLDMKMYQRSADWFLGVPFNMAQYAIMLSAMAQTTDRTPRYLYHTFGSAHIYKNHVDQMKQQLSRKDDLYDAPQLMLNPSVKDIGDFEPEDMEIVGYQYHPIIKGQVAI